MKHVQTDVLYIEPKFRKTRGRVMCYEEAEIIAEQVNEQLRAGLSPRRTEQLVNNLPFPVRLVLYTKFHYALDLPSELIS